MQLQLTINLLVPDGEDSYERMLKAITNPSEDFGRDRIPVTIEGELMVMSVKGPATTRHTMSGSAFIEGPAKAECTMEGKIEIVEGRIPTCDKCPKPADGHAFGHPLCQEHLDQFDKYMNFFDVKE